MKKRLFLLLIFSCCFAAVKADSLTLSDCQKMARENYPNLKNSGKYDQIYRLNVERLTRSRLPQASLNGQAIYQSDVFQLPFEAPGVEPITLPHEKYQATVDINQTLYDGGITKAQISLERRQLSANEADLETELLRLKEQVNELFFGVILARKKAGILQQTHDLLVEKATTLQAALDGGVISRADLLRVEKEILTISQQIDENGAQQQALSGILGIITGVDITHIGLAPPELPAAVPAQKVLDRPELTAVAAQQKILDARSQMVSSGLRPKAFAFFTGGFGYPNPYNFYDVEFSPFFTAGVKASWKLWDWRASSREKQTLAIRAETLDNAQATIGRNIATKLAQLREEEEMYSSMAERDRQIVNVEAEIREISSLRLDEGVITSTEYLDDVNAEKTARINYEIRKIQLIKTRVNYMTEIGATF